MKKTSEKKEMAMAVEALEKKMEAMLKQIVKQDQECIETYIKCVNDMDWLTHSKRWLERYGMLDEKKKNETYLDCARRMIAELRDGNNYDVAEQMLAKRLLDMDYPLFCTNEHFRLSPKWINQVELVKKALVEI